MINAHGNVQIVDFGLAKRTSNATLAPTGMVLGTTTYIAPETAEKSFFPASDLYAVGLMAWEMLVGRPPLNQIILLLLYINMCTKMFPIYVVYLLLFQRLYVLSLLLWSAAISKIDRIMPVLLPVNSIKLYNRSAAKILIFVSQLLQPAQRALFPRKNRLSLLLTRNYRKTDLISWSPSLYGQKVSHDFSGYWLNKRYFAYCWTCYVVG